MTEANIIFEINLLPENLKLDVCNYILLFKKNVAEKNALISLDKRVFGRTKGKYKLSPDFDEPLDDFKDYMS